MMKNFKLSIDDDKVKTKMNLNTSLKIRVRNAKKMMKEKGVKNPKVKFFDETFGALLKSASIRYDNLYAGYIADEDFTLKIEKFAKSQ